MLYVRESACERRCLCRSCKSPNVQLRTSVSAAFALSDTEIAGCVLETSFTAADEAKPYSNFEFLQMSNGLFLNCCARCLSRVEPVQSSVVVSIQPLAALVWKHHDQGYPEHGGCPSTQTASRRNDPGPVTPLKIYTSYGIQCSSLQI